MTPTDHETIDGALELLEHEDFFVGEEVSALFPEDGGQVEVLIYVIDPETHVAAQARRANVYFESTKNLFAGATSGCINTLCLERERQA